jgi:hypothetical protein
MDEQSTHQAQSEPQPDSPDSKRSGLAFWFLCAVGILLLYILSIGPAFKLALNSLKFVPLGTSHKFTPAASHMSSLDKFSVVYFPILRLCDAYPPACRGLNWYLGKVTYVRIAFAPNHHLLIVGQAGSDPHSSALLRYPQP